MEAGLVDHVVDPNAPDLVQAAASFARGRLPQVAGGLSSLRTGGRLLKVQYASSKDFHVLNYRGRRWCWLCSDVHVANAPAIHVVGDRRGLKLDLGRALARHARTAYHSHRNATSFGCMVLVHVFVFLVGTVS